tara:strand:+ start:1356 stop:1895 length:540 start_codon:yes stop_codon:yes gene_type:complete
MDLTENQEAIKNTILEKAFTPEQIRFIVSDCGVFGYLRPPLQKYTVQKLESYILQDIEDIEKVQECIKHLYRHSKQFYAWKESKHRLESIIEDGYCTRTEYDPRIERMKYKITERTADRYVSRAVTTLAFLSIPNVVYKFENEDDGFIFRMRFKSPTIKYMNDHFERIDNNLLFHFCNA